MVDGTELIAEAGEEVHQEDRVARERADALTQLQTPGAREDHALRPVTELPADLPSLITRLREEGSQLGDESVIPDNIGMQELPELKPATVDNLDSIGGGPRRVLLNRGFLNRRPNDTERIYPIQNRLSARQLKGRRGRIYYLMFLCWKNRQTRQWKRIREDQPSKFPILFAPEACMRVFPVMCHRSGGSQSHSMSTSDRHGKRWIWSL